MKKNLGVDIFLIKNNQVLLAKRKSSYGAGFLGCPGGRIDANETLDQTCQRELLEEIGVVPIKYRLIGVVKNWEETDFFIHFVYRCDRWRGEIAHLEPNKSEAWQWFDLDHLPANILPGHLAGIKLVAQNLKKLQIVEI